MTAANGDEQRPPPSSTQRRTEQADSSRPLSHAVPPPPPPPPPEGKTSNNNSKHHVRKQSITWTPNVEGANHSTPSPLGNPAFVADKRNDEAVVNPAMPVLSAGGALPSSADLPLPSVLRHRGISSGTLGTLTMDDGLVGGKDQVRPILPSGHMNAILADVISNPLEDEAEKSILRALEDRQEWEDNLGLNQNENQQLDRALYGEEGGGAGGAVAGIDSVKLGILAGISDTALQVVIEQEKEIQASVAAGVQAANEDNLLDRGAPLSSSIPQVVGAGDNDSARTAGSRSRVVPSTPAATGPSKFEDIAGALKRAQASSTLNLGAFAYAGGSNPPTSYLANAANIALGNTSVFSGTGTGTEEDNNSTTRRQMQLKKNDGPTSQADTMVKNMNQMFGLPNSIDEEHEMALPDGTISKASTKRSKRKESLDQIVEVDHEGEIDEESPFGDGSIDMEAATAVGAEIKAVVAGGVIDLSNRLQSQNSGDQNTSNAGDSSKGASKMASDKKHDLLRLLCCCPGSNKLTRLWENWTKVRHDITAAVQFDRMVRIVVVGMVLPSLFISAILYYGVGNPMTGDKIGRLTDPVAHSKTHASYSWWILFLGARQPLLLALSRLTEVFVVDFLALKTKSILRVCGPFVSLMAIQARGWPYIVTFWSIWNFAFLRGNHNFARHWLYYTGINMFGECLIDDKGVNRTDVRESVISRYPDCNPAGKVVSSDIYLRILIAFIVFGTLVAIKRVWLALYQGRKSALTYGPPLEKLMKRMLLITEVSQLANEIAAAHESAKDRGFRLALRSSGFDSLRIKKMKEEAKSDDSESGDEDSNTGDGEAEAEVEAADHLSPTEGRNHSPASRKSSLNEGKESLELRESLMRFRSNTEDFASASASASAILSEEMCYSGDEDADQLPLSQAANAAATAAAASIGTSTQQVHNVLGDSAKLKLMQMIGDWEEPTIARNQQLRWLSIHDILQFRQAVLCLDSKAPFGYAFGPANTRESCVESGQHVFNRLLQQIPGSEGLLQFDTLALITIDRKGSMDEKKARKLIRLFRPSRDGTLTALDFAKSCDKIYKDLRTLRAGIANSSQLDLAFESLINVGFYFILWLVVLTIVKLDPWTLFLSLSGFILSFAFMFGSAASKYFEGILLILLQKPYDIGDRIHIAPVTRDTNADGSGTWFVESVSLYSTTLRYAGTNEVATQSNGAMAQSRIINANRSPRAFVSINMKFASDVAYEKVMLFKTVIENFVKDRPREWLAMAGFRAVRVEANLGYIEYTIVLQHMEKWQNIGVILNSKAEVASYCLEVQKKLDIRYESPPMPVNLLGLGPQTDVQSVFERAEIGASDPDFSSLANMFAKATETKKSR